MIKIPRSRTLWGRLRKRSLLVVPIGVGLIFSSAVAPAQAEAKNEDTPKVTICHRTDSATSPYVSIEVDQNAVDGNAGNNTGKDHYGEHTGPLASSQEVAQALKDSKTKWGDIIPPIEGVHSGLNWTSEGQAIYNNGCSYVPTSPPPPPPEKCVVNPTYAYTFNEATGSGTITAIGSEKGQEICDPLYVRAAGWSYDIPASGSPSWGQGLVGYNDVTVDKIGTFEYQPPQIETCRQYDVYASFVGFDQLTLPEHLLGPNNPFEPKFLHQVLNGKGPNPTWSYTTSEGCNPPPPPPDQPCLANFDPATGYVNPDEVGKEPTQVENGLEFGQGDLIHFPGNGVSVIGLHDLGYTVVSSTGPSPAFKMEVVQASAPTYATWNWEPYMNGHNLDATGTFSNIENGLWWSSKIISGPGSQSSPIPLAQLAVIYPSAIVLSFGTGVGSTTNSVAVVSKMTFLCGSGNFVPDVPNPGTYNEVVWDEPICSTEGGGTVNGVHNFYEQAEPTWNGATQQWDEGEYLLVNTVLVSEDVTTEKCPPDIPEPKVDQTDWVDGQWSCGATTVDQTRYNTTTTYAWSDELQKIVATVGVPVIEHNTRNLTEQEQYACPVDPGPKVTYTDWTDGKWACNATTVDQTRTATTTTYKWDEEPQTYVVDKVSDPVTEHQTRNLTEQEQYACPGTLADTGADNVWLRILLTASAVGGGIGLIVFSRRRKSSTLTPLA